MVQRLMRAKPIGAVRNKTQRGPVAYVCARWRVCLFVCADVEVHANGYMNSSSNLFQPMGSIELSLVQKKRRKKTR